jgi:membrane-associated phospholipid phosphatase
LFCATVKEVWHEYIESLKIEIKLLFMKRILTVLFVLSSVAVPGFSQEEVSIAKTESTDIKLPEDPPMVGLKEDQVYILKPKIDIPVTAVGAAWTLYAFTKIYSKEETPAADILALNKDNINGFDRWAAGKSNPTASENSDYIFYGSMPLPIVLLLDKKIRKDAPKIGFLYLEAMAITGIFYTGSVYLTDRYRPETYNTSLPLSDRMNGNNRNSFIAGHPALVATSTFFCAKVYSDYHPESPWRWVFYGGAAAATGATAYLRHIAGKHFPTDLIIGTTIGTLSGILVPHLHKNKNYAKQAWNISPYMNYRGEGLGLSFTYRL